MTVAALLSDARSALDRAGVASAEWDAERLLRHVLGWDRAALLARADAPVPPEEEARFRALIEERGRRVPLQHLVGVQAFWKHEFVVGPDVLVPRPETETLVEASLELVWRVVRPVIVDVGTGSGCIALSLAMERQDATVHAVDVSKPALAVARENARLLGLEPRVEFHHGDLLAPVLDLAGRIDLVVSNPPYVETRERDGLEPEVRDHDPAEALFPPQGALALYRRLAREAAGCLRPGGWLAVEVPSPASASVSALFASHHFEDIHVLRDLAGLERVVHGRLSGTGAPSALG
jgi:release factor glutamine methyltransferase